MPKYTVTIPEELVKIIREKDLTINEAVNRALRHYIASGEAGRQLQPAKLAMRKGIIGVNATCMKCGAPIPAGTLAYFTVIDNEVKAICMDCYLRENSQTLAELRAKEREAKAIISELEKTLKQLSDESTFLKNSAEMDRAIREIKRNIQSLMTLLTQLRTVPSKEDIMEILDNLDAELGNVQRLVSYFQWELEKKKNIVKHRLYKVKQEVTDRW